METLVGGEPRFRGGLRRVADGVYAWLQPNGSWGESNAALVVGEGESLLVDTLWTPALTARMLERMVRHTGAAPIKRVVNTHADGDHWWGNQLLADCELVTGEVSAEEMREFGPADIGKLRQVGQISATVGRSPLPFLGRGQARGLGRFAKAMIGAYDFSEVELTFPTRSFSGTLELDVGGRQVELIEVGPAHTLGDLIVHVPDARTVIAGDIVFVGVTPVMWAGPPQRWIDAIDRMLALEPETIVPGHGPPTDMRGARLMQDYWRYVEAAARRRFAAGRSPGQAAREILRSAEFGETAFGRWENPERLAINLHSIRRGGPGEVGVLERLRVFADVGALL